MHAERSPDLQIVGIGHVGMPGVELNESVRRSDRRIGLLVLIIGVGNFQLRLLRIPAERVPRF